MHSIKIFNRFKFAIILNIKGLYARALFVAKTNQSFESLNIAFFTSAQALFVLHKWDLMVKEASIHNLVFLTAKRLVQVKRR